MLKREFQTLNSDDSGARDSGQAQSSGESDKKDPATSFFKFYRKSQVSQKTEVDTCLDAQPQTGLMNTCSFQSSKGCS